MPYQLRISLDRTPIWRRVVVPESLTLASLHLIIQQAMGWENRHLYVFEVGAKKYGPDDLDDDTVTLKSVFKGGSSGNVYDFGDWWEHTVTLEQITFQLVDKLVVAGEGKCPAEDSGWGLLRPRNWLPNPLRIFLKPLTHAGCRAFFEETAQLILYSLSGCPPLPWASDPSGPS